MTIEQEQKDLTERAANPGHFEDLYPIWKCPSCGNLKRFADTFGESCLKCKEEHTLDWESHIVSATSH